jgi:predicted Fe-S protein YdhL (DUF1289 family)
LIASPCVKVCVMDAEQRYCAGCLRTLDEIARWGSMSEIEQARLLQDLPGRRPQSSGYSGFTPRFSRNAL